MADEEQNPSRRTGPAVAGVLGGKVVTEIRAFVSFKPDLVGVPVSSPPHSPPEPDPAGAPLSSPPPPSRPEPDPEGIPLILSPVCVGQSRFKLLSLLDCDEDITSASDSTGGHGADNNDGQNSGEGGVVPLRRFKLLPLLDDGDSLPSDSSGSDDDEDGDPFLEDEASKPKIEEKKYSKKEILKRNDERKKRFMEYALQKYNNEEDLAGEMRFVFDQIKKEVYVVEGGLKFYEHFNFTAKLAGSTVLFFAEVVPDGDTCDVLCCKPLDYNDNGHCFSCKNQGSGNLRHPSDEALYVGGHEDCEFPFMWDSISEDDSD